MEHHANALARIISPPQDEDAKRFEDAMFEAVLDLGKDSSRLILRFMFKVCMWHSFYRLDAKLPQDHPAREWLPKYMVILRKIEDNPSIWRRCWDKARQQPETLP